MRPARLVLTNNAGGGAAAGGVLVADAKKFATLTSNAFANETGAVSGGQWIGTSVNAVYSIVVNDGLTAALHRHAVQWAADPLPESMFTRAGDSCAQRTNINN